MGVICHGPWVLVEAGLVRGRTLTSWPTLRTDIVNAGGNWVNQEVVVNEGIVTSRKPDDIPAFSAKLIEEIAEGKHDRAKVGSKAAAS
jgi:protease I